MSVPSPSGATTVFTATGAVDADSLGFVLPHEHLLWGECGCEFDTVPAQSRESKLDAMVGALRRAAASGVNTIVDPTPAEMGRDVGLIAEASRLSGVAVVFATGLYCRWPTPYFARRSADELQEYFCTELAEGVGPERARPGFIKLAIEATEFAPLERRALEAAAGAHRLLGTPLMVHCQPGVGIPVLRLLVDELGVDGRAIVIAHAEGVADLTHHLEIVEKYHSYVGFDRFGLTTFGVRDEVRIALVTALCGLGHADRIHLAHDSTAIRLARGAEELAEIQAALPDWEMTHIPDRILPALRRAGVAKEDLALMTGVNAARWLSRRG